MVAPAVPSPYTRFKRHSSLTRFSTFISSPSELPANDSAKSGATVDESLYVMIWKKNFFSFIELINSFVRSLLIMALLFTLHHRNKENEPSSLNGTAPPRPPRSSIMNLYSQLLPFNQNERKACSIPSNQISNLNTAPSSRPSTVKAATKASAASQINEDSPIIKQISQASGYASVEEFLASRDTNLSKATAPNRSESAATNGSKSDPNAATNLPKGATNGDGTKAATNGSKSTRNGAKNGSKLVAKGSKATTNPKKKAKSKYSIR